MDTKTKNRVGRPSKADNLNFTIAKNLMLKGFTIDELAQTIEVSRDTIYNWMKNKEFLDAIKKGREVADKRVEDSLYKRAVGYSYEEVTYEKSKTGGLGIKLADGEVKEIMATDCYKTKIVVKEVVPDVGACAFWLKNRDSETWKDRKDFHHSGEIAVNLADKVKDARLRAADVQPSVN